MNGNRGTKTPDLWTDYWQTGQPHACTFDFPEDTRAAIATKWRALFAGLDSGATILDVATGNGALVLLVDETTSPDHRLSVTGVDLAEIDPEKNAGLTASDGISVTFLGGTDAARLPFEDRQFTLVVSQFGLEYAGFEKAIEEACRVADARVIALVHAADSAIVRQNGMIPDQVDWLRGELGLFDAAHDHFQKATDKTSQRLSTISAAIRKECASLENPDFLFSASQYIGQLLGQSDTLGEAQAVAFLEAMEAQLVAHAGRMVALSEAARSETDLARASDICAAAGFGDVNITSEISGSDEHLVGRWLTAVRQVDD